MREWMSEVANVLAGAVKHPSGMTYCPQVLELSRPTSIGDMMSESRNAVRCHPKSSDPIREGITIPSTVTPDAAGKLQMLSDVPSYSILTVWKPFKVC